MKEQLIKSIRNFVAESNYNKMVGTEFHYFDEPVVKFAAANDSLFDEYKELIGPFHLTPLEAFELKFGKGSFHSGSVISIVLPVSEFIRKSNRIQKEFASCEWALLRSHGDETFINQLALFIVESFHQKGLRALSPSKSRHFKISSSIETGATSNWSERHIAYAAGQGSFSLNDGFITEKGMAIRLISIVTEAVFTPNEKIVKSYNEKCLFCSNGSCGACIRRCPVGAITKDGHDKNKCYYFVYGEEARQRAVKYGGEYIFSSGCGLCQTNVPCEFSCP